MKCLIFGLVISCGMIPQAAAQSTKGTIKVVEQIWGFNGKIQVGQFNPVSLLLDNQSTDAFDGEVIFQRSSGVLSTSGTIYRQQIYVGPAGRYRVQFYPYIQEDYQSDWRLTAVNRLTKQSQVLGNLKQPRPTVVGEKKEPKATQLNQVIVLLPSDAVGMAAVPSNLKRFPDEFFPPYAPATAALHTVFLNHEPDWEAPRQKSLMTWLKLGGNIHILQNRSGRIPQFNGPLSELNQPLSQFSVGAGRVARHEIRLKNLTPDDVERMTKSGVIVDRRLQADQDSKEKFSNKEGYLFYKDSPSSVDQDLYQQMQQRTQPDHAWWLIFLLAIVYILLIFPGCYWLSKKRNLHFLATYGAIAGISIVFSVLFLFIGQRGYGESTWLQTFAVAKVSEDGDQIIHQWNSFFVTSGDYYTLSAEGQQAVMSAGVFGDNTDASILLGPKANTAVRIPPFSTQTLTSSRYAAADPWNIEVLEHSRQGNQLVRFKVQTADGFPKHSENSRYYLIAGNEIFRAEFNTQSKQLTVLHFNRSLANFCERQDGYQRPPFGFLPDDDEESGDSVFLDSALPLLIRRLLIDSLIATPNDFYLPDDRVRLLVLTELPEQMDIQLQADTETLHSGWILYSHDILVSP